MNKTYSLMLYGAILLILILSFASANTLIAGKIYNSDYSNTVSGALVTVTCDSEEPASVTTLSDGTFAVVFGVNSCTNVDITTESDYEATDIKINIPTDAPPTTESGHSSNGNHFFITCGNKVCDSTENSQTCLRDCPEVVEEETSPGLMDLSSNSGNSDNSLFGEETQNTQTKGNKLGMTGAFTGTSGNGSNALFVLFGVVLLLIIAIAIIALIKGNNKKKKV